MNEDRLKKQCDFNIARCREKADECDAAILVHEQQISRLKHEKKEHLKAEKEWEVFYKETLEEDAKNRQFIIKYNLENPNKKLLNDLP